MQAFLINLARRGDRLRQMSAQLSDLNLPFQIVTAIDAKNVSDAVADRNFASDGPLGPLPKGDKCCSMSHMLAWNMFLSTGDSHALILEDDVALDRDGVSFLQGADWIPRDVGLLKIEHFGPNNQRVLLEDVIDIGQGRQIGRLLSRHTGAAAYILNRDTATKLLTWPELWTLPVDHLLFNPNNSPLANVLRPYQMTPAIARQVESIGGGTDIEEWREELRGFSWRYIRREAIRAYYEIRLLPRQLASFTSRNANFVRVEAPRRH